MLDCIIWRCDTDEDEMLNYAEFSDVIKHKCIVTVEKYEEDKYYRNSSPLWTDVSLRDTWTNYSPTRA